MKSSLQDPDREKLIAGQEYPLHKKYGFDEVVTVQLTNKTVQSNLDGSNIFGTMEIRSRHG